MIRSLFLSFSLARSRVPLRKRRDGGGERHSVHSSLRHRSPRNRENMAADARRVSRTAARKSTVSPFTSVSHTASISALSHCPPLLYNFQCERDKRDDYGYDDNTVLDSGCVHALRSLLRPIAEKLGFSHARDFTHGGPTAPTTITELSSATAMITRRTTTTITHRCVINARERTRSALPDKRATCNVAAAGRRAGDGLLLLREAKVASTTTTRDSDPT